jgi:MSHA biogenesis protein MshQ
MVAAIGFRRENATITPPSGWTLQRRTDSTYSSGNSLAVYTKVAGGSEPTSYTWSFTNWENAAGGIQSFSGVDTAAAVNVENGAATADSLTHATPSITPTVANTMLVTAHTIASSATWTPPTGMTEAYDTASPAPPAEYGQAIVGSYAPHVFLATGAKSATASAWTDGGNAHILALRPLPATGVAGGFNGYDTGTAGGATSGFVKTKIAGSTVSVAIISLNLPRTAIETSFTGTVRVEVLNASDNSGALDANGCRSSWTVLQTVSPDPTFVAGDNGRDTISFTQPNSYKDLRLRVSFPTTSPTRIGCSNDNFAMRPDQFTFTVTDGDWQTAGTTRTLDNVAVPGGITHKAGRPFTVQATALNAVGATTTNYVDTPIFIPSVCTGSACTATAGTFTLGGTFVAGVMTSNAATYSEVGSIRGRIRDSVFSNVDASDGSSGSERDISASNINIGRFVPDNFAIALNTPVFGTTCGSFTYVGESFNYTTAPVITVTARNFAGGTTVNYANVGGVNLWQITNANLSGKSYTAAAGTLNTSGITGTDPTILPVGSGVGTLTFSSGTGLFFTRSTPVAPFDADISLAINLNNDADGIPIYASNPARFSQATAGNGIAFSSGKPMRFGRLTIRNANGSPLMPLLVALEAQYYTGAPVNAFITNTADSCTNLAAANVAMSGFTQNLAACETANTLSGAFSSGRKTLLLPAPGSANNGSVNLRVNLAASASGTTCTTQGGGTVSVTAANRAHLQGNWTGANYDQDPTARATFGVSRGANEVIYVRENF